MVERGMVERWTYVFAITNLDDDGRPTGGFIVQIPDPREASDYARSMNMPSGLADKIKDGRTVDHQWTATTSVENVYVCCQSKRIKVKVWLA